MVIPRDCQTVIDAIVLLDRATPLSLFEDHNTADIF